MSTFFIFRNLVRIRLFYINEERHSRRWCSTCPASMRLWKHSSMTMKHTHRWVSRVARIMAQYGHVQVECCAKTQLGQILFKIEELSIIYFYAANIKTLSTANTLNSTYFLKCVRYCCVNYTLKSYLFVFFQLGNLERKWQHHELNNFVMKECILLPQWWSILILSGSPTTSLGITPPPAPGVLSWQVNTVLG